MCGSYDLWDLKAVNSTAQNLPKKVVKPWGPQLQFYVPALATKGSGLLLATPALLLEEGTAHRLTVTLLCPSGAEVRVSMSLYPGVSKEAAKVK